MKRGKMPSPFKGGKGWRAAPRKARNALDWPDYSKRRGLDAIPPEPRDGVVVRPRDRMTKRAHREARARGPDVAARRRAHEQWRKWAAWVVVVTPP